MSAENPAETQHSLPGMKPNLAYSPSGVIFLHSKMYMGKLWYTFKITYCFSRSYYIYFVAFLGLGVRRGCPDRIFEKLRGSHV